MAVIVVLFRWVGSIAGTKQSNGVRCTRARDVLTWTSPEEQDSAA